MNEFVAEVNERVDDKTYTPETIAYKLLFDDNISEFSSKLMLYTSDTTKETEPITYSFEALLTIFMELIFGIMKINFYSNENNTGSQFIPNINCKDFDDVIPLLKKKFDLINVSLFVEKIPPTDENRFHTKITIEDRYCNIIIKHNKDDVCMCNIYNDRFDSDKLYHMILNSRFVSSSNKLSSVYATASIDGNLFKICFEKK
jgi:hypothetical protein